MNVWTQVKIYIHEFLFTSAYFGMKFPRNTQLPLLPAVSVFHSVSPNFGKYCRDFMKGLYHALFFLAAIENV